MIQTPLILTWGGSYRIQTPLILTWGGSYRIQTPLILTLGGSCNSQSLDSVLKHTVYICKLSLFDITVGGKSFFQTLHDR